MAPRARLSPFEWACILLIGMGLSARFLVYPFRNVNWDSMWYLTMGKSFVETGEFTSPWLAETTYTRHFPPAYPLLDALAYWLAGPSFIAAATVSILVAVFFVAVGYFTTKDLYGRSRGLAVAAILATSTILIQVDLQLLSESLVAAFFALTIWGILKSLDNPRYIVFAGLFAGLGYLTKASMGPFFLLAGAGGFAWRFYYVRWRVFQDKWYMGAAFIFASFVLLWGGRNVLRHGWPNWETQPHAGEALQYFFAQNNWPLLLGAEFLWGAVVLSALMLAFLPEIGRSFREIRDERTSALWLAVVTPSVIGLIFAASFASFESRPILSDTAIRYLITPIVPLLWLGTRRLDLDDATPTPRPSHGAHLVRGRLAWLVAGAGIVAFLHFASPIQLAISFKRLVIYILGCSLGIAILLVARTYTWKPTMRETTSSSTLSWRATRARLEGAPTPAFVIGAFVFAIGIGLFVALQFFILLVPLAASLAAGSPQARVLVLAACTVMVPLAGETVQLAIIQAAEDVNTLAADGDVVSVLPGQEFYVYPWLRADLPMVTPDRPHDWFLLYGGANVPDLGFDYELEREYRIGFATGPGGKVAHWLWGNILGEVPERERFIDARLYRVVP